MSSTSYADYSSNDSASYDDYSSSADEVSSYSSDDGSSDSSSSVPEGLNNYKLAREQLCPNCIMYILGHPSNVKAHIFSIFFLSCRFRYDDVRKLACWFATGITSRDGELRWFEDVAWDALRQKAQDTITIDKKRKIHCHLLCGHEDWPSESALMLELRTAKDCWNAFSKMDCYVWLQLSWTWQLFMSCSTVTISFRCSQQQGSGADGAAWALQEIVGIDKAQPRTWLNNLPHCGHWSQVKVVASTDRALAPLKFLLRNTAPKTLLVLLYFHKDININICL